MRRRLWGPSFSAAILLTVCCPRGAAAFDHDVHYAWTYYLALHAGFSKRQAFQMASAAYSIDADKDTDPLENSGLADGVLGAERGFNVNTKVTRIWRDFHCFERTGSTAEDVRIAREQRFRELWDLGVAHRNPGPLIHWLQDSFSHHGYDDTRGHFAAGHKPDFISYDRTVSVNMTNRTLALLQDFREKGLKLPRPSRSPDMARVYQVMDRMIAATASSFLGRPDLSKAVSVVNQAVAEDEQAGRLSSFPIGTGWDEAAWGSDALPPRWQQFDNDADGKVKDPAYAVEQPVLTLSALTAAQSPAPAGPGGAARVEVRMRASVTLTGAAPLLYIHHVGEMPVLLAARTPGAESPGALLKMRKVDGTHPLEVVAFVDKATLARGPLKWSFEVTLPGAPPVTAACEVKDTAGGGRLKFMPLSDKDAEALAKSVNGGGNQPGSGKPGDKPATGGGGASSPVGPVSAPPFNTPAAPIQPTGATFYDQGRDAFSKGDWKGAAAAFNEAISLRPDHPRYHHALCAALIAEGRPEEAAAAARVSAKLDPGDARNQHALGFTHLLLKNWMGAEQAYRAAIKLAPETGRYHAELGLVLLRLNRQEEAQAEGREGQRLGYASERIYRELGLTQ